MKNDLLKLTGASFVALALAAGPVAAQTYHEWDADQDGVVSQEEYNAGLETSEFGEWDNDMTSDDVFAEYDQDEDGSWSAPEYGRFNEDYPMPAIVGGGSGGGSIPSAEGGTVDDTTTEPN
ncbi:hypothetical protein [Lutibaculum baratangense]|uniref:EF-hand domain-containing protein n=1 Tax=Lutibaculum baratangense AMV1 TaxID=631454 RepID=V4RHM5_9HYPH|nr:hypothetical protein [Lutibaculum baratangense]ESR25626.1 hypothetical protein N177_1459 [Lutibaculum baratangense AMV1]